MLNAQRVASGKIATSSYADEHNIYTHVRFLHIIHADGPDTRNRDDVAAIKSVARSYVFVPSLAHVLIPFSVGFSCIFPTTIPLSTKHLYNICTTFAQRLLRCSSIVQMLYKCFVFTGTTPKVSPTTQTAVQPCTSACTVLLMTGSILPVTITHRPTVGEGHYVTSL